MKERVSKKGLMLCKVKTVLLSEVCDLCPGVWIMDHRIHDIPGLLGKGESLYFVNPKDRPKGCRGRPVRMVLRDDETGGA